MQKVETKENAGGRDQARARGVGKSSQIIIILEACLRELELGCSSVGVQWCMVVLYSRYSKCDSS
jgi:hypothetical protein